LGSLKISVLIDLWIDFKGVVELKWTKIDVKMSTFMQFLLNSSMWCHFNGMWIMESCPYWIIWILNFF
jgi:hypothetical protein